MSFENNNISVPKVDKAGIIVYVAIDNKCEGYMVILMKSRRTKKAIKGGQSCWN